MCLYKDDDALLVCGDLNSIIGSMSDTSIDLDELNGHLTPQTDSYTVVNNRGHSIFDYIYIIMPSDVYNACTFFELKSCETVVEEANIEHLLSEKCKIPDHAVLNVVFFSVYKDGGIKKVDEGESRGDQVGSKSRRYKLEYIPDNFLM